MSDPVLTYPEGHDPLGVLETTRLVVQAARQVRLDRDRIRVVARDLASRPTETVWDTTLHWHDPSDPGRSAAWVFVLDALNFCFWSDEPDRRWRVRHAGIVYDGYAALAEALKAAMTEGVPLTDPDYLATISDEAAAALLQPDPERPDTPMIPLFPARVHNLRELGTTWQSWRERNPRQHPALTMLDAAEGSAAELVRIVVRDLPSFNDVATYRGQEVRFYKRAQILAGDLAGAFDFAAPAAFSDLDGLTAFADYKVPQVMRHLGLLVYDDDLANRIARWEHLPAGSPAEVEIRAAPIWGCELLRQEMAAFGRQIRSLELDWLLWTSGQQQDSPIEPYHRTLTIYY
jgi:hypothetical protein